MTTLAQAMTTFVLTRIFRHVVDGVLQVSDFQDTPPTGDNDLEVRMKHFTEIENFTLLGEQLAASLRGGLQHISTLQNLTVPDPGLQARVNAIKGFAVTPERLGDLLLDMGLNWEHFVASNNNLMIPGDPLKVSDAALQAKIDSLDLITEALVKEVNLRAMQEHRHGR